MFRLAFFGAACIALAACALVRTAASLPKNPPLDHEPNKDQNRLRGTLLRFPALGFHARFSVN